MPRVQALAHTAIVVRDLDSARRFYGGVLGLKEIPRPGDVRQAGTWFDCKNSQLHIIVAEEFLPEPSQRHFALEVEDFDETVKAIRGYGIRIIEGPRKRDSGMDFLVAIDPDGNTFEITHR